MSAGLQIQSIARLLRQALPGDGSRTADLISDSGNSVRNRCDRAYADSLELAIHDRIENLRDVWLEMEKRCAVSVYQRYEWISAFLGSLDPASNIQPMIVEGRIGGETVFILPFALYGRFVSRIKFIGGSHTNFNLGLFAPEYLDRMTPDVMHHVFRRIGRMVPGGGYFALCCQPETWKGQRNPLIAMGSQASTNTAFALDLDGGFDATLARGNAKRKRKKFRQQCRMSEQFGGHELIKPATPCEIEEVIEVFFEQKSQRLRELGIRDVFSDEAVRSFVTAIALESAEMEEPLLQLYALRVGGNIAAVFGGGVNRGRLSGFFSSFDSRNHEALSPGEMLLYLVVEDACASGWQEMDLGAGDERYKRSWSSEEVAMHDVFLPLGPLGQPLVTLRRVYGDMRRLVRGNETAWEFYKRVRRARASFFNRPR